MIKEEVKEEIKMIDNALDLDLCIRTSELTDLEKELIACISYMFKPIENAIDGLIKEKVCPNDLSKDLIKNLKFLNIFEKYIPKFLQEQLNKRAILKFNFKIEETRIYEIVKEIKGGN